MLKVQYVITSAKYSGKNNITYLFVFLNDDYILLYFFTNK